MGTEHPEAFRPLNRIALERQLRELAGRHAGAGVVDDLELQHLVSVILHGALLLHDLYSSDRIGTVYAGDPRAIARTLISPLVGEGEGANVEVLARVGRLPDQVRLLGDKCLFDVGITRIRQYNGLDLRDLGVRAYRMASEVLDVLAEDGGLRELFDRNRLAPLPLSEEVTFLKQCAERFGVHADLLMHLPFGEGGSAADVATGLIFPGAGSDRATGAVQPARAEKGQNPTDRLAASHPGEAATIPPGASAGTAPGTSVAPSPAETGRPPGAPAPPLRYGRRSTDRPSGSEGGAAGEFPVSSGGTPHSGTSGTDGPAGAAPRSGASSTDGPAGAATHSEISGTDGPAGAAPRSETSATDGLAGALEPGVISDFDSLAISREDMLSCYERIILFASLDVNDLREKLNAVIVDQPEAVEALCDEFSLYATGTHSLTKPPSYFFVGPTGVGKNYLVESLVRLLGSAAGVEIPLLTIEGPNYTDASDINELRGSTRGFVRSDEPGLLAEFHERSSRAPLSVILIDEVEKAHPHLRKFFLSMMDRGTVTDNRGRSLFFANSMIVFTSNMGFSEAVKRGTPIGYKGEDTRAAAEEAEVGKALRHGLSAEFVNRLRIIRFQHLSSASIQRIFDLEFEKVQRRFREVHDLELRITERAKNEVLARGYSYDYGARHLAGVINRIANVEVSKRLKKDDALGTRSERDILEYLRQVRRKERAFNAREVRARVLGAARVRVSYSTIEIDVEGGEFVYTTFSSAPPPGGE